MVVIKGIGIISPLGQGKVENLAKMREGKTAIRKRPTILGDLPMAKAEDFSIPSELCSMPRPVQFGYIAMKEAIEEAGLTREELSSPETAFIFSSSKGDLSCLDQFRNSSLAGFGKKMDKNFWQNFLPSGAATYLAGIFNLQGPQISVVSACATGAHIIARACEMLLQEKVKRVIAGASEAPLVPLLLAGYDKMGVLSHSEMRPFDKNRDGFSPGEGGVCLILEKDGEGIGRIRGLSLGSSGGSPYRFEPDGDTLVHCLKKLINENGFFPEYINTHGTATFFGDLYETNQIKKAFGKDACKIRISSTKSMTGHLLGVSGLLEFALSLLCLRAGFIPATAGLRERDPDCDLNYVAGSPLSGNFHNFLTISYGFGGSIACILGCASKGT